MGNAQAIANADWGGPRVLVIAPQTAPAAGADAIIPVPGRGLWEVLSVFGRFTTNAAVGNRQIQVALDDQTTTYARIAAPAVQAASAVVDYTFAKDAPSASVANATYTQRMPAIIMPGGHRITLQARFLDAGDAWSVVGIMVMEYQRFGIHYAADLIARYGTEMGLLDAVGQPSTLLG